ncbi:MAG: hypothetical protein OEV29_13040 [Thermoleophilia bacterium]|nr:hypothetical protein [Thermoleophilia bacterium]
MIGKKKNITIEQVLVAVINCDYDYQRDERNKWVKTRVERFDPRLLNVGEVSLREDGTYWAIDCQHRVALCKEAGHEKLTCRVHTGLSRGEEAELFRKFNRERSMVGPMDDWNAAIFQGDEKYLGAKSVTEKYDFEVAKGGTPYKIGSVKDVLNLYNKGLLGRTLKMVRDVWGYQDRVGDGRLLSGVGLFLEKHDNNSTVTDKKIKQSWSRTTPSSIIAVGEQFRGAGGVKTALEQSYNHGRSNGNRIGPFANEEGV